MIKCIVIDDEKKHRDYLREILEENFSDVKLIGEATGVIEGIQLINQTEFDILFLDIEMPPLSGFDVLKSITKRDFAVIFTTAYDKYAVNAVNISSLYYLLKPYSADDLKAAIKKYQDEFNPIVNSHKIKNLLHNINPENNQKKIGLSDKSGVEFFEIDEIVYCKSDNVYTTFFFQNKSRVISSKPIKDFERDLEQYGYYRIHNSYLVNLKKIKKYIRGDGGQVLMTDGSSLDVARNKKEGLLLALKDI